MKNLSIGQKDVYSGKKVSLDFKNVLYTKVGLWRTKNGSSKIVLKNKCSLLASLIPWRTFNILGSFPFHKRLFIVEKCSSDYSNILHTKINECFNQNGTKNCSSMTSLWKTPLGTSIFKSVAHFVIFIRASHTWCVRSTINIRSIS